MNDEQIKIMILNAASSIMNQLELLENLDVLQNDIENQMRKAESTAYAACNLIEQINAIKHENDSVFNRKIEKMKQKAADSTMEQINILENLDTSRIDFDSQEQKARKIVEISCNAFNQLNRL